jgi:hypothetical protein
VGWLYSLLDLKPFGTAFPHHGYTFHVRPEFKNALGFLHGGN